MNERLRSFALCADDFAMAPGISHGILQALEAGVLTATSAMTTSPWWPEHARELEPYASRADLGLHLNLTQGRPLTAMPVLAPNGVLPPMGEIARRSVTGSLPLDEIEREIEAQVERFVAVLGRPPDHVDGHQHVHVLRPIRRRLLAVLRRRGWRPWLRDSGDSVARILRRRSCLPKALGLTLLAGGLRGDAAGLPTNAGFAGFSDFRPGDAVDRLFAGYLLAPGPRHLVMCHPGYVDAELRRLDPVVETREHELAFLLAPAFQNILERGGMRLVRMSAMVANTPLPSR